MAGMLEEETGQGGPFPFVLHCFTGGMDLARRGLDLGGYLSFSGIVTFKNAAEIQAIAEACPADRYLVETDAPYLAPVPYRGKPNEPSYVRHTAEKVAELRGISIAQLEAETTANFGRLFSKTGIA
jgi:TatD DNase family protein